MPTEICKNGHDHSRQHVAIPLQGGRKYHCPVELSATKHLVGNWKEGSLAEAREAGVPACERCFGRG